MTDQSGTSDQIADRLYGLPLDEFTPERDAAAKRLRQEGSRGAADAVRRLRKPNRVAWALNQVRRTHPEAVDELIAAGVRLRTAQRQLVAGGERGQLRSAAAQERELVGRVAELGERALSGARHPADGGTLSRLFSTLHAAAGSQEVAEALRRGRLLRDHEISDLGLGGGGALGAGAEGGSPGAGGAAADAGNKGRAGTAAPDAGSEGVAGNARPTRTRGSDIEAVRRRASEQRAAPRRAQAVRRRLERARQRRDELDRKAKDAQRRLTAAERAAAKAATERDRSAAAAGKAADAAEQAAGHVAALEVELAGLAGDTR